jgi:flagellar motor switch/type III secretory pathway protein FliN
MTSAMVAARRLHNLPSLDPARMQLTNALLALLSGKVDLHIFENIPEFEVFAADGGMAFALLSAREDSLLGTDASVDHACDVLDAGDALLRHVETRLGIRIEPVAIEPAAQTAFAQENSVMLRIGLDEVILLLAMHPDTEQISRWIDAATRVAPDLSAIPLPLNFEFEAAKLPVAEVAALERGDMMLLPSRANASWRHMPHATSHPGIFDISTMTVQSGGAYYDEEETGMSDGDIHQPAAGFAVPVTVRLPTQYVDAVALATLQQGGSLQLGPLKQGLAVELLVGGRQIAAGEIVEIGQNFAVLIDETVIPAGTGATLGRADDADIDLVDTKAEDV